MYKKFLLPLIALSFYSNGMNAPLSKERQNLFQHRARRHSFPQVSSDANIPHLDLLEDAIELPSQHKHSSRKTNTIQKKSADNDNSKGNLLGLALELKDQEIAFKDERIASLEEFIDSLKGLNAAQETNRLANGEYIRSLEESIRIRERAKRIYLKLEKHYAYLNGGLLFCLGIQISRLYKNGKYTRLGTVLSAIAASAYTYSNLPKTEEIKK